MIRPATYDDLEDLLHIERQCFVSDLLTRRAFIQHLPKTFVYVLHKRVVGYIIIFMRYNSKIARVYSLAVLYEVSSIRIGTKLLKHAEKEAKSCRRTTMQLEVREDNDEAIGLYVKHGYECFNTYRDYYADKCDALRFRKEL